MELLLKHLEELQQVCKIYKVDNLYTFGSILTDKFNSNSDIDFIVSISLEDPIEYAENYFNLKFELEKIFDRKIDLLEQKSLNNRILEKIINREKNLFMNEQILVWLEDIENSIGEIKAFTPNPKLFQEFEKDKKARRAIERNIEIIGEAMNRIIRIEPEIPIRYSRKIVETRNRIIHGYDTVSSDILWLIIIRYIPILEEGVKKYKNDRIG